MNYKLLQEHISASLHEDINPVLKDDKSNVAQFFVADVVGNKRFAQNFGGYPRSEIAEINAQANLQAQMNLLSELQDYSPFVNSNAGKSDVEIMLSHRSKYCQSPTEQVSWLEGQLHERYVKALANAPTPKDNNIVFSETETPES